MKQSEISAIFYRLPPAKIVVIKSLLESYESVGELRTLDADGGIVVVLALPNTESLIREIVTSEKSLSDAVEIPSEQVSDYLNMNEDWLLGELFGSKVASSD